ncbi:hypothetical protein PENANT_c018G11178 [Penicillium antarcticum]|uniref:RTA1 domain protein n=1 Tax=Penicillium antarcticum TaxID=416450 RepID=A0A1V6Q161_9EURO|nr:hypothetical protein PENANT_c018G11178 [Penicillium antarcticum]
MVSSESGWVAYTYNPSMAAAVIFVILFAVITLLHTFHLIRTRTWFFIPLVIGGYFELIGYIGRAITSPLCSEHLYGARPDSENGPRRKIGTRAGIMVTGSSSSTSTGQNVIIGGLFVQIIFFGFFLISALVFQMRMRADAAAKSIANQFPWRKHMWALHASSILVLIRSVVRVVEYIQGTYGYIMSHEAFIYVFDGLLMFVLMVIFVVVHPSEVNYLLGRGRAVVRMGGLKVENGVMCYGLTESG